MRTQQRNFISDKLMIMDATCDQDFKNQEIGHQIVGSESVL